MIPVRIIKHSRKEGQRQYYMMALNPDIADLIPEDARFVPELTEDGILFRFVKEPHIDPPSWVKENDAG